MEILQLLQGYHLDNFPLKTLKLGRVPFHSLTFQFQRLDFQSDQYKKLAQCPHVSAMGYVLSGFYLLGVGNRAARSPILDIGCLCFVC